VGLPALRRRGVHVLTVALIDGDIVAFRASAAAQRDIHWDDGDTPTQHTDARGAAEKAVNDVAKWAEAAKCTEIIVAFTGRKNFRKLVLPSYKGNRVNAKPLAYVYTVDAIAAAFETRLVEGLEADDLLGIMLTNPKYSDAVCITIDKDLRTVPGIHLNPVKERRPVRVRRPAADYYWMTQALTGDTTDGYKGLPGTGPAKAAKILGAPGGTAVSLWPRVVAAYATKKLTEADALVQARVARILRFDDYDRINKGVRLWHPRVPETLLLETI